MKIRYMIEFKKIFFVILMCIESQSIICSNITHYNDTSNRYVYYDTITMTERGTIRWRQTFIILPTL